MDEVFADPQVEALGIAVPVTHPERGEIRLVGQPVELSRTPASVRTPVPDPGQDTDAILGRLGYAPDAIRRLRESRVV
jgi:crotonobetainyl-CoA:carnitine CoA-transferase CaiB-like acyl-CoA transferase